MIANPLWMALVSATKFRARNGIDSALDLGEREWRVIACLIPHQHELEDEQGMDSTTQ